MAGDSSQDEQNTTPLQVVAPTQGSPDEFQFHWITRIGLAFTGIVLPLVCFLMAATNGNPFKPDWQNGTVQAYTALLISETAPAPFLPMLLCSMAAMGLLLWRPAHYVQFVLIRFAIYTGVLLGAQYCGIVVLMLAGKVSEFAWISIIALIGTAIPWGFGALTIKAIRSNNANFRNSILAGETIVIVACAILFFNLIILILPLFFATPWALAAYLHMSIRLVRHGTAPRWRFSLARCLGIMTWFGVWFAAWRLSVTLMLEEYMRLPVKQPNRCYVATAAARGHARFVGSTLVAGSDGFPVAVNAQLRYLKAAELMIICAAPRLHRGLRLIYDALGPRIAASLSHPLLADIAYVSLKPAEWIARGSAWLLLNERYGQWLRGDALVE